VPKKRNYEGMYTSHRKRGSDSLEEVAHSGEEREAWQGISPCIGKITLKEELVTTTSKKEKFKDRRSNPPIEMGVRKELLGTGSRHEIRGEKGEAKTKKTEKTSSVD